MQGLCFNCNDKFSSRHGCQAPRLLLLEGHTKTNEIVCEDVMDENLINDEREDLIKPKISLRSLIDWPIPRTMQVKAHIGHHNDSRLLFKLNRKVTGMSKKVWLLAYLA